MREQKLALKELQQMNRDEAGILKVQYQINNEPKEWRSWNKMEPWQRKEAFQMLQVGRLLMTLIATS